MVHPLQISFIVYDVVYLIRYLFIFFSPLFIHFLFILSFIHSYIHSFIHSFIHAFIHSFIHSFVHSFIRSFVHSFIQVEDQLQENIELIKELYVPFQPFEFKKKRGAQKRMPIRLPELHELLREDYEIPGFYQTKIGVSPAKNGIDLDTVTTRSKQSERVQELWRKPPVKTDEFECFMDLVKKEKELSMRRSKKDAQDMEDLQNRSLLQVRDFRVNNNLPSYPPEWMVATEVAPQYFVSATNAIYRPRIGEKSLAQLTKSLPALTPLKDTLKFGSAKDLQLERDTETDIASKTSHSSLRSLNEGDSGSMSRKTHGTKPSSKQSSKQSSRKIASEKDQLDTTEFIKGCSKTTGMLYDIKHIFDDDNSTIHTTDSRHTSKSKQSAKEKRSVDSMYKDRNAKVGMDKESLIGRYAGLFSETAPLPDLRRTDSIESQTSVRFANLDKKSDKFKNFKRLKISDSGPLITSEKDWLKIQADQKKAAFASFSSIDAIDSTGSPVKYKMKPTPYVEETEQDRAKKELKAKLKQDLMAFGYVEQNNPAFGFKTREAAKLASASVEANRIAKGALELYCGSNAVMSDNFYLHTIEPGVRNRSILEEDAKYMAFVSEIVDREKKKTEPLTGRSGSSDASMSLKSDYSSKPSRRSSVAYNKEEVHMANPASFLSLISHETNHIPGMVPIPGSPAGTGVGLSMSSSQPKVPSHYGDPSMGTFLSTSTMQVPIPKKKNAPRRPKPEKDALSKSPSTPKQRIVQDPSYDPSAEFDPDSFDVFVGKPSVDTDNFDMLMAKKALEYEEKGSRPGSSGTRPKSRQTTGRLIEYPEGDISLESEIPLVDRAELSSSQASRNEQQR